MLQYSIPPISDFLHLSGQKLMDHALKNRLTESPGLLLHTLLCQIVGYTLAKNLPESIVDIDILNALCIVSHSTRVIADEGLKGIHPNPKINEFMQNHSNIDFAYQDAIEENFSPLIIQGIRNITGNPRTRIGYFPHETMLHNDGTVNWTQALSQIASWSIAGGITNLHTRFDDLRARRSFDIGRLELMHIKQNIQSGEIYNIPAPILYEASMEFNRNITNVELLQLISQDNQKLFETKLGNWILNSYERWADMICLKYCNLIGVADFNIFLYEQLNKVKDPELYDSIRVSFESAIGRKLRNDEFFPTIPGIDLLYKRIGAIRVADTQKEAKMKIEKLMSRIDRSTRPFVYK